MKVKRLVAVGALVAAAAVQTAPVKRAAATPQAEAPRSRPAAVYTAADSAKERLHPSLREQLDGGAMGTVTVFATVTDPAGAEQQLDDARVAFDDGAGLVVGTIAVHALAKLAGAPGVVAVSPIDLDAPAEDVRATDDPAVGHRRDDESRSRVLRELRQREVPYSSAPAPRGSNFEALKELAVLDARTHSFADAWNAGYTGAGVTAAVFDGGTDFAHPDLLGTWQTWSGLTGARAGWNGWPKAFDPMGTLFWLVEPSRVDRGLTWYTKTTRASCAGWATKRPTDACAVQFATRTGPDRDFIRPSGTVRHTYRFPAGATSSGVVRLGSHPDDNLLHLFGERPAFLVTDATTPGVYDTVYVDLDGDHRFDDEKPVTKTSPASYRDMDGDGYGDLSGGLLYYVSDGVTPIPGGLDMFGILDSSFGPGELLAWNGDFDPAAGGHGTIVASNLVGQGVVNGRAPTFSDLPGGTYPGAVIGGAPHAKLAPFGTVLRSPVPFNARFAHLIATRRGIDVTSNSYFVHEDRDADGWDAGSQELDLLHHNRGTTSLFLTANNAPGFGTTTAQAPSTGIKVGASTQFGGTGWDSIDRLDQIVEDDVMVWSGRGPGATGTPGVDIVASGAYGPSDVPVNSILDGRIAWETVGGTSRATPVAAGATALLYQAWRQSNGPVPPGFYNTVKESLKSSADDLGYDSMIQGAGRVDAVEAIATVLGQEPRVSPGEWRVGDYRGAEHAVFTHLVEPGGTDAQHFAMAGPTDGWQVSDRQLVRTDTESFPMSSAPLSDESPSNFNAPDYLVDLSDRVAAHPEADLMTVRLRFPQRLHDTDGDYIAENYWRLLTYNWTDNDGDGTLWSDGDGDGVVDHRNLAGSSNIDFFFDVDFAASEIDEGEYIRFMHDRAIGSSLQSFVREPSERMADGLFLGLQHAGRTPDVPVTPFEIQIDWYENRDWGWVTTTEVSGGGFDAAIDLPADAPYGMYSGAVVLTKDDDAIVVPVVVAVAATVAQDAGGSIVGSVDLGGAEVAAAQRDLVYNNGSVFGGNNWAEREAQGDWRFFFLDVPVAPPPGSLVLARTTWESAAPFTDIDTLLLGRGSNRFEFVPDGVYGAPYVLDVLGRSEESKADRGVWRFLTSTGGADDLVAAPAQEGLHAVALHQVGWDGDRFDAPFSVTFGGASVAPAVVDIDLGADEGTVDLTFTSGVPLDGLRAEAFGLSEPMLSTETAAQDDPSDPSSASIKRDLTLDDASRLRVSTALGSDDLDLFVLRDENGDGEFGLDEIVAVSASFSSNEFVELVDPLDGDYQIWVHGFSVEGSPEFELSIEAIQGDDIALSGVPVGPIPPNTPVTMTVELARPMVPGRRYLGEVLLGPPSAPRALRVRVVVDRV